jgi:hypothetical protein
VHTTLNLLQKILGEYSVKMLLDQSGSGLSLCVCVCVCVWHIEANWKLTVYISQEIRSYAVWLFDSF